MRLVVTSCTCASCTSRAPVWSYYIADITHTHTDTISTLHTIYPSNYPFKRYTMPLQENGIARHCWITHIIIRCTSPSSSSLSMLSVHACVRVHGIHARQTRTYHPFTQSIWQKRSCERQIMGLFLCICEQI